MQTITQKKSPKVWKKKTIYVTIIRQYKKRRGINGLF